MPETDAPANATVSQEPPAASGGREVVLLVEDEVEVRRATAAGLRELGYTVYEASGSAHALDVAERTSFDLLITDVVMPRIGGGELAEAMRARHAGIRVLFVSGYPDDPLVQRLVADREAMLLSKPIRIDALARRVRRALET